MKLFVGWRRTDELEERLGRIRTQDSKGHVRVDSATEPAVISGEVLA